MNSEINQLSFKNGIVLLDEKEIKRIKNLEVKKSSTEVAELTLTLQVSIKGLDVDLLSL